MTTLESCAEKSNGRLACTERHRSTLLRLVPLRQIEKDLKVFLGAGSGEVETISEDLHLRGNREGNKSVIKEFSLHSSSGWKSVFAQLQNPRSGKDAELHRVALHVVRGCKDDIQWMWSDNTIKDILHDRGSRLEDLPGL